MRSSRFVPPTLALAVSLILIWVASESPHAQVQHVATSSLPLTSVDQMFQQEFSKDNAGALTVGLVRNGELVWTKSYGFLDANRTRPANSDSVYPVASVSKIFVGIMLLQMVEQGRVHFTDPVAKYFPEIRLVPTKYPWAPPITLIQLATMSSGLQATPSSLDDPYTVGPPSAWRRQLLAALPHMEYAYEPGTSRLYSNVGYAVLAAALEQAAGMAYLDYIQQKILAPLDMNSTHFFLSPDIVPRLAAGFDLGNGQIDSALPLRQQANLGYWTPVGGLFSTVPDLAKLMRFQMGNGPDSILKPASLESSFHLLVASDADLLYGDSVGFSAVRNEDGSLVALGHGGLLHGYVASYEFDRSTKTGLIVLSSSSAGKAEYKPLVRKILSMLNPGSRGGTGEPLQEIH
jgi:CubicO group peptidase (beta-lactamase class C family)